MCIMPLLSFSQKIKWAKSYQGIGGDQTYGSCIWQSIFDSQGNLYVCGTVGRQGKMGDVELTPASAGGRNSFFAKLDSNGQLLWSKSLSPNTANASDYCHIRMQLVNDTILYIKSQVYPPQDEFTSLCWFLDTLITYPVQDSIPFFPKTMCPHEAFLKLNQDGELLDAHYIYNWVDDHWSKDGVEYVSTYRKTFEEDTQFYVDKDGNYYIFVRAWNIADTNVLNFVVDDKDTIKYAINSNRIKTNTFLKFDSNFNFVWSKDVFPDDCGNFYETNLSFDEEDNMYLSGFFASSEYKWLDLGNNQRIKRSYPGAGQTGFIIKYDTSCTPQWVNQMFLPTTAGHLAFGSCFRQSVVKGDTVFVQYGKIDGLRKEKINDGEWFYFDSLYLHPMDTLNAMGFGWEHSGYVAYDKNTGQYLSHGLIKGRSEVLSNVAVSNGQVYGQVYHNNSWDIGGLDTIMTYQTPRVLSLFKWNAADGEILEVIDNYEDGGSYGARHMSQNNYEPTEIFVSGKTSSDTMDLHDTIVVTSLPDYGGVYMFVLKDSSVFNHYNVIRDTICDSADWNGYHITWKGEYRDTLQAADGYDSIILYRVQVRHSFKDEQTIEINEGERYDFHGQMLYEAGTYYDSLQTINGCDSIYILNLKVKSGLNDIGSYVNIESVNVAPNPAKDEAVITYTIKDNGSATFVLYNSEGQELISKQLVCKGKQHLSLSNYPVGTYFYKVFTSEKVIKSDKLVIAR